MSALTDRERQAVAGVLSVLAPSTQERLASALMDLAGLPRRRLGEPITVAIERAQQHAEIGYATVCWARRRLLHALGDAFSSSDGVLRGRWLDDDDDRGLGYLQRAHHEALQGTDDAKVAHVYDAMISCVANLGEPVPALLLQLADARPPR